MERLKTSGERLKGARKLKSLKLKDLAQAFDVGVDTILDWQENGIPPSKISAVANYFKLEDWVFVIDHLKVEYLKEMVNDPSRMKEYRPPNWSNKPLRQIAILKSEDHKGKTFKTYKFYIERSIRLEIRRWGMNEAGYFNFSLVEKPISPDFEIHEFNKDSLYEDTRLESIIKNDLYNLPLKTYGTDFLNDILRVTNLYERMRAIKEGLGFLNNIDTLIRGTREMMKLKSYKDLSNEQKHSLRTFNRRLLEEIYSQETPKLKDRIIKDERLVEENNMKAYEGMFGWNNICYIGYPAVSEGFYLLNISTDHEFEINISELLPLKYF